MCVCPNSETTQEVGHALHRVRKGGWEKERKEERESIVAPFSSPRLKAAAGGKRDVVRERRRKRTTSEEERKRGGKRRSASAAGGQMEL